MSGLESILRRIESASGFADLIQLEKGLNLSGALARLDEDKANDVPAAERDLRVILYRRERGFHIVVGRLDRGLLRGLELPCDGGGLAEFGNEEANRDERRIRELRLVDMRAVLRDGEALGADPCKPANLACKREFDGVDNRAFS